MKKNDLPVRWQQKIENYTNEKYGADYKYHGNLGAGDFASGTMVHIHLCDGSLALFNDVFIIEAPDWNEFTVFTEHCGYHLCPFVDT